MAIRVERLPLPAYLVASLLIVFPVFDSVAQLWPLNPSNLQWRFGALGLASQALMTPLLGLLLLSVVARLAGHSRGQFLIGLLSLGFALACLGTGGLFGLDAPEVRELIPAEAQPAFQVSAAVALAKYLLVAVIAGVFGRAGVREARRQEIGRAPLRGREHRWSTKLGARGRRRRMRGRAGPIAGRSELLALPCIARR